LSQHEIEYGIAEPNTVVKGYDYGLGQTGSLKTDNNTLVVTTNQPKGTMVKVLFEPNAKLSDSLTYDITAWSLPYAYGLDAIAATTPLPKGSVADNVKTYGTIEPGAYAYITDWNSMQDARFLAELFKKGIKVRVSNHAFSLDGDSFPLGSLIITKADNETMHGLEKQVQQIGNKYQKTFISSSTGFVDSGKDFGSNYVQMIKKPKIAVFSGEPTSTLGFGEVWHFFEKQLQYPVTILDSGYFENIDLYAYDILILPHGRYGNFFDAESLAELKDWVYAGGKLITIAGAIDAIDGENGFGIKLRDVAEDTEISRLNAHENSQRERIKNAITGAIFKVKVDNSHPLAYGYDDTYFTLKLGSSAYEYLDSGNVAYFEKDIEPVSGFAGSKALKSIHETLVFGVEDHGRGHVIYLVDNPLFRGFWENGKLFFANALFMVD